MLEPLFGSSLKERILLYLMLQKEGYAYAMARTLKRRLFPVQEQLRKLEEGGVVGSRLQGRTRVYVIDPRYAFREELLALLKKAYDFFPDHDKAVFKIRTRPRKAGKLL